MVITSDPISLTLVGYFLPNAFRKHYLNEKYINQKNLSNKRS